MFDLSLFEKLCRASAVSSGEATVRNLILENIKEYVDSYEIDRMGNLLAFKKGKKRPKCKAMLCAHMDEVGFIITDITDDGYLRFACVGGIDHKVLCGRQVFIAKSGTQGIIGLKPIHLTKSENKKIIPPLEDLMIDIGASSRKKAAQLVCPGDLVGFPPTFECADGIVFAKALDDRVGCLALIEIIQSDLDVDLYFSFTVQEEVGLRGGRAAAYKVAPDVAIVVEATTAADFPQAEKGPTICSLGGGAVLSFMDKRTMYDRDLLGMSKEIARRIGARVQMKKGVAGGNDAGAIQETGEGCRVLAISVPCRYLHSELSIAALGDIEEVIRVTRATAFCAALMDESHGDF